MADNKPSIEALIEAIRQKTERYNRKLKHFGSLLSGDDDRRIDNLFHRRKKPRNNDPQGREQTC